MSSENNTTRTLANVIQLAYQVIVESEGNGYEIPADRKENKNLILKDIGKAVERKVKQMRGVA